MDALYFIKVIIEGKDNLSPSLRSASATMRAELAKLRNEVKGLDGLFMAAAGGQDSFRRSSRNSTEESKRQVEQFRSVKKNVSEVANAFRASKESIDRFERSGNTVERMLFRLNSAFRGASRAIYDTQRGVRDMDFATRRAEGSLFNLAYNGARNLDNFTKSFTRMNTVAALLAPLLFTVIQAVLNLGAALVALASAAGEAAAALGGALLSGLMQLVPVVGLLVASFQRLQVILQAHKLQQQQTASAGQSAADAAKAHREAVERLSDAQYNLAQAYVNVKNQAFDLQQAELALVNTRRQAARDLVDSQNARIDAVLAERAATLSLKDAKLQLAILERQQQSQADLLRDRRQTLEQAQRAVEIAKQQGDPAQLSMALQQLGVAQSNYSSVAGAREGLTGQIQANQMAQARLAVDEAVQRQKESQITLSRAIEDNNRLQKYGVDHAPDVIQAEHNIATATNQLAAAHRNVAKAIRERNDAASDLRNGTYSGANAGGNKQLDRLLSQLDPVEKKLLATIDRFMEKWKQVTRPITDAVLLGINNALDIVADKLLGDSKFMKAWERLGKILGEQIERFAKFISSPAQKRFFESFIDLAGKNLPTIVTIFERVLSLVERIALAFAPVFNNILGGVNKWLGQKINRSDQRVMQVGPEGRTVPVAQGGQTRIEAFATESEGFLKSLAGFFGSLFHLMGAIGHIAKGPGKEAFESLTDLFNTWARELRTTKEQGGKEFFENAIKTSGLILKLMGAIVDVFFKLAGSSGFDAFVKTFGDIFVPALERFGTWYGDMFKIVVKAGDWGGLNSLLSWVTSFYLLSKLTPLGQLTATAWHALVTALLGQIAVNTGGIGGWLKKIPGFPKGPGGGTPTGGRFPPNTPGNRPGPTDNLPGGPRGWLGQAPRWFAAGFGVAWSLSQKGESTSTHDVGNLKNVGQLGSEIFYTDPTGKARGFKDPGGPGTAEEKAMADWAKRSKEGSNKAGDAAGLGFITGFLKQITDLAKRIDQMVKENFVKPLKASLAISSPSKVTEEIGKDAADGFTKGFKYNISLFDVAGTMRTLITIPLFKWAALATQPVSGALWQVGAKVADAILAGLGSIQSRVFRSFDRMARAMMLVVVAMHERWENIGKVMGAFVQIGLVQGQLQGLFGNIATLGAPGAKPPKSHAIGGTVEGSKGQAVPIIAHAGEWVLNSMQQGKLANILRRPLSWIRRVLFGDGGGAATGTVFGGKDDLGAYRMLSNWNDEQFDASGNQIYGGTYFVETPLGQWVQLARATIAKMQRKPGWLPDRLLQSTGFQGASADQIRAWSASMYRRANDPYFQWHTTPDHQHGPTASFAAGGVVTTPAASMSTTHNTPQRFEIHTKSPTVDIDYVMRVAKLHAEST